MVADGAFLRGALGLDDRAAVAALPLVLAYAHPHFAGFVVVVLVAGLGFAANAAIRFASVFEPLSSIEMFLSWLLGVRNYTKIPAAAIAFFTDFIRQERKRLFRVSHGLFGGAM